MSNVSMSLIQNLDLIRSLEEELFKPSVRRSPEMVGRLLAEDFVEFGRSGRIYDRALTLSSLAAEDAADGSTPTATDFLLRSLAENVVLLTYRSCRQDADGNTTHSLRSSIWKFADGRWQMLFHQGTPTKPE